MSKKALHIIHFSALEKSNILCSVRFIHFSSSFGIKFPNTVEILTKWCHFSGISNWYQRHCRCHCITWRDKRRHWGEGQMWTCRRETDGVKVVEKWKEKRERKDVSVSCLHDQNKFHSRPHRCQRTLPWQHFEWLPNLIGPSGCGTFFLHFGKWGCCRARSPTERPADRWEERERERERERESERGRENACYHLHLRWWQWSILTAQAEQENGSFHQLISLTVYQLNHTS